MNKNIAFVIGAAILASVQLAEAQKPAKLRKIGFLTQGSGPSASVSLEVLRQGLRELGHVEGRDIVIEYRSGEGRQRLAELAAELVREKVDVIVAQGAASTPAKMATGSVPIVFAFSGDPVEAGFVESFARPGRNMTGMTFLAYELVGKRLELLKETVPKLSRVAVLANPGHPGEQHELRETQNSARTLGTTVQYYQVRTAADFGSAFDAIMKEKPQALLVFPDAFTNSHRKQIGEFATTHKFPSVFGWKEYVEAGGLMSYGPNRDESYKRIAVYVDKIVKGRKVAELPVEQPTKFELIINLKAAKQIGLTIPPNVLARADRVIR